MRTVLGGLTAPAVATLLLAAPSAVSAQPMETLGTRALGMGGAFVAVADDATAPYWNPAGLATGASFSFLVERQLLDLTADRADAAPERAEDDSGLIVSLGVPALGLSYYRLRRTHVELPSARETAGNLITHHTAVTLLQSLGDSIAVGTAFKYVRGIAALRPVVGDRSVEDLLDEAGSLVGKATNAFDVDVGVMLSLRRARIGLVARNLREPGFETPDGVEVSLERQVRAGLAVLPAEGLIVSADLDLVEQDTPTGPRRELAAGLERSFARRAAVRGGFRVNLAGEASPVGALGASLALKRFLWVDVQMTRGGEDRERGWGLGVRVAF